MSFELDLINLLGKIPYIYSLYLIGTLRDPDKNEYCYKKILFEVNDNAYGLSKYSVLTMSEKIRMITDMLAEISQYTNHQNDTVERYTNLTTYCFYKELDISNKICEMFEDFCIINTIPNRAIFLKPTSDSVDKISINSLTFDYTYYIPDEPFTENTGLISIDIQTNAFHDRRDLAYTGELENHVLDTTDFNSFDYLNYRETLLYKKYQYPFSLSYSEEKIMYLVK